MRKLCSTTLRKSSTERFGRREVSKVPASFVWHGDCDVRFMRTLSTAAIAISLWACCLVGCASERRSARTPDTRAPIARAALVGAWVLTASRSEGSEWEPAHEPATFRFGPSGRLQWTELGRQEGEAHWSLDGDDLSMITPERGPWTFRLEQLDGDQALVFDYERGRYHKLERRSGRGATHPMLLSRTF